MKIYLVGGAVRDKLLNLPVKERDYVVVGASIADMLKLGYQQVGKEFPVFLHPQSREEYALARMERKTKPGYTGFSFDTSADVTLEDDLLRRDLTINAMAESETGEVIDPYHGQQDLDARLLRHVSKAFAEDPVRILRIARFLARYANLGFSVAPDTVELMKQMVKAGEVDALVAERVWKELERALGEQHPEKFFEVLSMCSADQVLFPTLKQGDIDILITAATLTPNPAIRFAALLSQTDEQTIKAICDRYKAPNAYRELSLLAMRHHATALSIQHTAGAIDEKAAALLTLFYALDIFRREPRFQDFLVVCNAIALTQHKEFSAEWLYSGAQIAKSYDVQELIRNGLSDKDLADALKLKRLEQIIAWLKQNR